MAGNDEDLGAAVTNSGVPAFLIELPAERILAGSPEAFAVIRANSADVIGRTAGELLADEPETRLTELLAQGRLLGFEAWRSLRLAGGRTMRLHVWVRGIAPDAPTQLAVALVLPADPGLLTGLPAARNGEWRAVFGTLRGDLTIDRISTDAGAIAAEPVELIGTPFLRWLSPRSMADALTAIAEALGHRRGVSLLVEVPAASGAQAANLVINPLLPEPSYAFSLIFGVDAAAPQVADNIRVVQSGLHALDASAVLGALDRSPPPGWSTLSPRESEICARLLAGDRVPAIAQHLFLSQSTVRNTLSTAYRKLRVSSQQELVDLFRATSNRPESQDKPSRL